MKRPRFFLLGVVVLGVFLFLNLTGCTLVFQKGRKSDLEKIQSLEREIDQLARLKSELAEKLKGEEGVTLSMDERGLVVTLLDEVLFDSGKDKIKSAAFPVLNKVSSILTSSASGLTVGVEGHADNEPIKHSGWKSNWELSTARATSVLHYLIKRGVAPQRLSAIGYGEYRPVASNATKEGRRQNRRVEIVLLPQLKKVSQSAGGELVPVGSGLLEPKENLK